MFSMILLSTLTTAPDAAARPHLFARSGCTGQVATARAGCSGVAVQSAGCQGGTAVIGFSRTRTVTRTVVVPARVVPAAVAIPAPAAKVVAPVQPPTVWVPAPATLPMPMSAAANAAFNGRPEPLRGVFHRLIEVRPLKAVAGAVCGTGGCR